MKRLVLSSQTPPSDVLRSAASRRETVYFVIYVSSHTSGHAQIADGEVQHSVKTDMKGNGL